MKISRLYIAIGLMIAFVVFFELAAHADEMDQSSKITFSEPIQIPGQVLPAGTYVFELVNANSQRHLVRVFNTDRTVLYATLSTIATERHQHVGYTVVRLAEQGTGQPDALVNWFYPGDETGHEFVYADQKEKQLAQDTQRTIVAHQPSNANSDTSGAGN
jgi:hypothetical protein